MEDSFYIDFENKFRGSRALIKDRLTVYLPIIEALHAVWPNGRAVDFGCGRGEWLELLGEHGWQREGIDSNRAMVEYCKSVNLPCKLGDAIEFLKTAKSESFVLITGFHIAEHLGFDVLREFLKQAHRVLAPGGILILETPNPENLMVGACNFYVDPTHQRPLPPMLMQFLIEHAGFSRSTIMRLNGPKVPTKESDMTEHLSWAIGAHPDYSVVAQGKSTPETAGIFKHVDDQAERYEDAFSSLSKTLQLKQSEWEVQLQASQQEALRLSQALAEREQQLGTQLQVLAERESELAESRNAMAQLESRLRTREAELAESRNAMARLKSHLGAREAELAGVYRSWSWRMTAPLRKANFLIKQFMRKIRSGMSSLISLPRRAVRQVLLSALAHLQARPGRKAKISRALSRLPFLHSQLRKFSRTRIQTQGSSGEAGPSPGGADPISANRFRRQLELELIRRRQIH